MFLSMGLLYFPIPPVKVKTFICVCHYSSPLLFLVVSPDPRTTFSELLETFFLLPAAFLLLLCPSALLASFALLSLSKASLIICFISSMFIAFPLW